MFSLVSLLCCLMLLAHLGVVYGAVCNVRVNLRAEPIKVSPNWREAVESLVETIEDDLEFRRSLTNALIRDSSLNHCHFDCITCNERGEMQSVVFRNAEGRIDFSLLPRTVAEVSFIGGKFYQSLTLTTLPISVKSITFDNTIFTSASVVHFRRRHSMLSSFSCIGCGIHGVDWASLPPLLHLNLGSNPIFASIELQSLPATLRYLNLSNCGITTDAASLAKLPISLVSLDVSNNQIHGEMPKAWPPLLQYLDVSHNHLDGTISQDSLPFSLAFLAMSGNGLVGALPDFTPFTLLETLLASKNNIEEIAWELLPPQLCTLNLSGNAVTSPPKLSILPTTIKTLDVSHNLITGTIDLGALPLSLEHFNIAHNKFYGEPDLSHFSDNMRYVFIEGNEFTGTPDLTNLPVDLRCIVIGHNKFHYPLPPEPSTEM